MIAGRDFHPSDERWRRTAHSSQRSIIVIDAPASDDPPPRAVRRVPFGFGVRKPHYRFDLATGEWVRA